MFLSWYLKFIYMHLKDWMIFTYASFSHCYDSISSWLLYTYETLRNWMVYFFESVFSWIAYVNIELTVWTSYHLDSTWKLVTYFYITCAEWTAYYFSHTLDLLIATSLQLNWWIWSLVYILVLFILFLILFLFALRLLLLVRSNIRNCWQTSFSVAKRVMQVISNTSKQALSTIWWLLNGVFYHITLYTRKTWCTLIRTGSIIEQSCRDGWHSVAHTRYAWSVADFSRLWSTSKQVVTSVVSYFVRILVVIWGRTNPRSKLQCILGQ